MGTGWGMESESTRTVGEPQDAPTAAAARIAASSTGPSLSTGWGMESESTRTVGQAPHSLSPFLFISDLGPPLMRYHPQTTSMPWQRLPPKPTAVDVWFAAPTMLGNGYLRNQWQWTGLAAPSTHCSHR